MDQTKIATLENMGARPHSRLFGVAIGLVLSFLLLTAATTAYLSGIFVNANNESPTELIIRNVKDTTAQIYWTTQNETQGLVVYGTTPQDLSLIAPEVLSSKSHQIDLSLLKPATTYYFAIKIGGNIYDNAGVPWTFTTKGEQVQQAVPTPTSFEMFTCPQTSDCEAIKAKLGDGCNTSDYLSCLSKKGKP